jgi:hypothetical protein
VQALTALVVVGARRREWSEDQPAHPLGERRRDRVLRALGYRTDDVVSLGKRLIDD